MPANILGGIKVGVRVDDDDEEAGGEGGRRLQVKVKAVAFT